MKLHSLIPIVLLITTLTTGIPANAENPRLLSPQLRSTSNVFGDVNGDGETDVKDVTALISYVLGATPPQFVVENANINGEGEIDVQDVTALINYILTGEKPVTKWVGGDISMLPLYEKGGAKYLDYNGATISNVLTFFKAKGMNSMRVRLFVNPENASDEDKREGVRQGLDYVKELGKRIKKAGLKFALDMHYSDTWADPGQQATPSAWSSLSVEQMANQVYNYTCEVLDTLKSNGAVPDLIQIGNETTYGMLWPSGRCYPSGSNYGTGTWANYAAYINNGIKAVREKCPSTKIILHTELHNTTNVINFYRQLKNRAIDYDVIGLSYYPDYHGNLNTLNTVLNNLENTFPDKAIMIMETGYGYAWQLPGATNNYTSTYPLTEAGQRKLLSELISTLNKHNNVKGLFWWWPEANEYGINYTNAVTSSWWNGSLFNNNTGKALKALEEFQNFK